MDSARVRTYRTTDLLFSIASCSGLAIAIYLQWYLLLVSVSLICIAFIASSYIDFDFSNQHILYLLLFSTFLLPIVEVFSSIPKIRPEHLLFFSVIPIYLVMQKRTTSPPLKRFILFFGLFQLSQLLSLVVGYSLLGVPFSYKDIIEVIRVLQYGLAILVIGNFVIDRGTLKNLLILMVGLFTTASIIGLFQYYGIFGFDWITAPLYSEGRISSVHIRVMGTFVNPNTFGSFLAVGILLTVGLFSYTQKVSFRSLLLFCTIILLFAMILTKSRTALIALSAGFVTWILLNTTQRKRTFTYLGMSLAGVLVIGAVVFYLMPDDAISRLYTLTNISQDLSWQMRLYAWYIHMGTFLESPLIGWGPGFGTHNPIVDSEYVLILRRYGIVGMLLYLSIYFLPAKHAFAQLNTKSLRGVFNQIFLATIVVFLVTNITNPLFHEMQFMNFWCIWVGILYATNNSSWNLKSPDKSPKQA